MESSQANAIANQMEISIKLRTDGSVDNVLEPHKIDPNVVWINARSILVNLG
jgi:hypothetical protein